MQVRALLEVSDVFILNSQYEGLPHVVLEAMAAGVPVVATRVGGTPELVKDGDTGMLIPSGDVQALIAAIRQLLSDIELRKRLSRNAHEMLSKRFGEEKCFLSYEAALLQLVTTPGTPPVLKSEARRAA
jgi:glycosyltransferase involved in cell wall biosynthesis